MGKKSETPTLGLINSTRELGIFQDSYSRNRAPRRLKRTGIDQFGIFISAAATPAFKRIRLGIGLDGQAALAPVEFLGQAQGNGGRIEVDGIGIDPARSFGNSHFPPNHNMLTHKTAGSRLATQKT
jgi:hypothetical protein